MALSSAGSANAFHHTPPSVTRRVEPGAELGVSSARADLDWAASSVEMKAPGAGGAITWTGRIAEHAPSRTLITTNAHALMDGSPPPRTAHDRGRSAPPPAWSRDPARRSSRRG